MRQHAGPTRHDKSIKQHNALRAAGHTLAGLPGGGRWRHRATYAVPGPRSARRRGRPLLCAWRAPCFRNGPDDQEERPESRTAADRMKAAGIVQDGDPVLNERTVPFQFPDEADEANSVIARLFGALHRVG